MRPNEKLYFLFIDVDSFKQINDTYGHNEGDRALKIIAEVLSSLSEKTGGFCARYAGDEFAFIRKFAACERVTDFRIVVAVIGEGQIEIGKRIRARAVSGAPHGIGNEIG